MDKQSGELIWRKPIGSVAAAPTPYLGRVYVGTRDGRVKALERHDGKEYWAHQVKGAVDNRVRVAAASDMVLFTTANDKVVALDYQSGKPKWEYAPEPGPINQLRGSAGLAIASGVAFTGFSDGSLRAIRISNGSLVWSSSLSEGGDEYTDVDATPKLVGDLVVAANAGTGVYGLERESGGVRWKFPLSNVAGIAADRNLIYLTAVDKTVALDHKGILRWSHSTEGYGDPSPPVIHANYLIYSLRDGGVVVVDKTTGTPLQRFDPGDGVSTTPWVHPDGDMFFVSNRGILYAFHLRKYPTQ